MAGMTKIQWCDATFNPWIGCSRVAEGCRNCYAENLMDHRYGRVQWGPHGSRSLTKTWRDPLKWQREAEANGEQRKVFCASLADVFEDWRGQMSASNGTLLSMTMDDARIRLFELIDTTPNLNWLLLTKRPENINRMWPGSFRENVWLGTSIAEQKDADRNIDRLAGQRHLADTLFLSVEPQIEFVDLGPWLLPTPQVDWVIIGGESKQGNATPRPFNLRWARDMLAMCHEAGVPCFIKQYGSNVFDGDQRLSFKDSHGGDIAEWEAGLRVRECPESFEMAA